MRNKLLKVCIAAALLALFPAMLLIAGGGEEEAAEVEYKHVKWYDDGSIDIITFEDEEVIHLTKEQLGTMFGPGKQPYAGKQIAITVNTPKKNPSRTIGPFPAVI